MYPTLYLFLGAILLKTAFADPMPDGTFTTISATCTPTPVPNPPKHLHCGTQGIVTHGAYLAHFQSCTGDYIGCYETCASESRCKSFSYRPSVNFCNTFSKAVIRGQGYQSSSTSGIYFYNFAHCFKPAPCTNSCPTTTSTTSAFPTPTHCGNSGVGFAYYSVTPGSTEDPDPNVNLDFNSTDFKTRTPNFQGTTTEIGGFQVTGTGTYDFYGVETAPDTYFVLNHRGYIYGVEDGSYTFAIPYVDDQVRIWVGADAYSGWNNSNEILYQDYLNDGISSTSVTLSEGVYYPFRILFGQSGGPGGFNFSLTAPDGTVIVDDSSSANAYVVQYSCDGTTAPPFPAFGSET